MTDIFAYSRLMERSFGSLAVVVSRYQKKDLSVSNLTLHRAGADVGAFRATAVTVHGVLYLFPRVPHVDRSTSKQVSRKRSFGQRWVETRAGGQRDPSALARVISNVQRRHALSLAFELALTVFSAPVAGQQANGITHHGCLGVVSDRCLSGQQPLPSSNLDG